MRANSVLPEEETFGNFGCLDCWIAGKGIFDNFQNKADNARFFKITQFGRIIGGTNAPC